MAADTGCIDLMLSGWNTRDESALREIVEEALSPDIEFCDPRHDIRGHAPFIAMVREFQAEHGDCRISRTSKIDAHHDRARYTWSIAWPDGRKFEGFDSVTLDLPAGRVCRVDGFFGALRPA